MGQVSVGRQRDEVAVEILNLFSVAIQTVESIGTSAKNGSVVCE